MANYFADGFQTGMGLGVQMREGKKRREQEQELARAERELRLTSQAKEYENRKALQEADQAFRGTQSAEERAARLLEAEKERTWRSGESDRDRGWRGGESEKERGFRRGERIDSQGFQSSESALNRAAQVLVQDKELKDRGDARAIEMPLKGMQVGLQARQQEWAESPENPLNMYRKAHAQDADAVSINGGPPSPLNITQPQGKRMQFSQQDEQAYNWAMANSSDPRAKEILKRLGVK